MMIGDVETNDFVFDSQDGIRKSRIERENMRQNKHLALQFPIPELRHYFHPTFPGRWTLVHAQSHNFKTEWVNFWAKTASLELSDAMNTDEQRRGVIIKISVEDAVEGLIESEIASFGGGELQDIAQGIVKDPEKFIRAETHVGGLPIVHIGESLGMDDSNASLLSLSNIEKLIDYVRKDHFGQDTPIAGIFADYLQAFPMDSTTGSGKMIDTRTLQINRDVDTFRRICKRFFAPGVMVAQSSPDDSMSTAGDSIKIPGFWDIHWSKYPAQRADFMYSLWMPKMHYPVGQWVDSHKNKEHSRWNFCVTKNGLWIKAHKHKKFPNVGAAFPLTVSKEGNVSLDKELFDRITRMESNG